MHCPRELDMFDCTTAGVDGLGAGSTSAKVFELRSSGQFRYRLKAVVEHVGSRIHGGHFICYIRIGDIWNLCDDHKVSAVRDRQAASSWRHLQCFDHTNVLNSPHMLSTFIGPSCRQLKLDSLVDFGIT